MPGIPLPPDRAARVNADRVLLNAKHLKVGAAATIAAFGAFLIQHALAPGTDPGQWQDKAFPAIYIALICSAAALLAFLLLAPPTLNETARRVAYSIAICPIIGLSTFLSVIELTMGDTDLSSMFGVLLGICVFVSASWYYYLLMGMLSLGVFIAGRFLVPGLEMPVDASLTAAVLAAASVGLGTYLERYRQRSRLLTYELEEANEELREFSLRDGLTGVLNRRYFDEAFPRAVAQAGRYGERLSLLILDMDGFKELNERSGRLAADDALRATARALSMIVRGADTVARLENDAFAAILPRTEPEEARRMAERLKAAVAALDWPSVPRRLSASAGIASFREGDAAKDLIERAEQALRRAKREGTGGTALAN